MILKFDSDNDRYVALDNNDDEILIFSVRCPVFLCSDNKYRCVVTSIGNIF